MVKKENSSLYVIARKFIALFISIPTRPFLSVPYLFMARDSSVGIATAYGLDGPEIESRWGARFSPHAQIGPGAHPASYTMRTGSFPGVNWPGRDVDHPPPHLAPRLKKE